MPPPSGPRDLIAGPETPQPPYPLRLRGPVIKGFGRGSKELGIPTANIPITGLSINGHTDLPSGIYYGWASLDHGTIPEIAPSTAEDADVPAASSNHAVADLEPSSKSNTPDPLIQSAAPESSSAESAGGITIYPTVLSIGYNPFYANTERSIEIHILHQFPRDFYGATLSLLILGYIRPEYDYVSKDALVEDIREDIRVARRSLEREGYMALRGDGWLMGEETEAQRLERKKAGLQGRAQRGAVGVSYMEL